MRRFYDPEQERHAPAVEMHNGGFVPYKEHVGRLKSVLAAMGDLDRPQDFGMAPIEAVHSRDYLEFLSSAHGLWQEAGREGDALPYAWPIRRRRDLNLQRIDALLGRYSFDATTPVTATTWNAVYASAQIVLSATRAVLDGERCAFAICRPPGHHAGPDYMGGYGYLNNSAIAAQYARDAGHARVAILDVDYHHGNGTQDIFWNRGDVFYASVHADPATDYPYYWGHADETGEGAGKGTTLNLPLARGADMAVYGPALEKALKGIADFAPDFLIVSFGADTFAGDPISEFRLTTEDYETIAAAIAAHGWPTVIVLEGGYDVENLGTNVASFLRGFEFEPQT